MFIVQYRAKLRFFKDQQHRVVWGWHGEFCRFRATADAACEQDNAGSQKGRRVLPELRVAWDSARRQHVWRDGLVSRSTHGNGAAASIQYARCVPTYFAYGQKRINMLTLLKSIVTNPLILALFIGFACHALRLRLPGLLASPISKLGAAASPLAMRSIGLSFEFSRLQGDRKFILTASAIKILLLPLLFTLAAVALGYRGNALFAIYLIHAVPTARQSQTPWAATARLRVRSCLQRRLHPRLR